MSGFIAATIGESRGRQPMPHWVFGLLLPGIYPALINSMMINRVVEGQKNQTIDDKEKYHAKSIELTSHPMKVAKQEYQPSELKLDEDGKEVTEEKPQEADTLPYNRLYFTGIAQKNDGTPAGPFAIVLNDGRQVDVDFILEILDDVVIFQIDGNTGKPRKLRLAYKLITACEQNNT